MGCGASHEDQAQLHAKDNKWAKSALAELRENTYKVDERCERRDQQAQQAQSNGIETEEQQRVREATEGFKRRGASQPHGSAWWLSLSRCAQIRTFLPACATPLALVAGHLSQHPTRKKVAARPHLRSRSAPTVRPPRSLGDC